jgi:hypothetical protein
VVAEGTVQAIPPTTVEVVAKVGDPLGGSTIDIVNSPFTNGQGKVGFVGRLLTEEAFVWYDTGPVFFDESALPDVLIGGEGSMGIDDTGGWIYSPSVNGQDSVYTNNGLLMQEDDPLPTVGSGLYSAFNSRPSMLPDGTAHWISGITNTPGGSSTGRVLFRAADTSNPAAVEPLMRTGLVVEGQTVIALAFYYGVSDNGLHYSHILTGSGASGVLDYVYLDGSLILQEGTPNWDNFDLVEVNNDGHYVVSGDTAGATTSDEFLAYNGVIQVREGDTLDGTTLVSGVSARAASINNHNQVVHIWGQGISTLEYLFFGNGPNLERSVLLLELGDEVDVDADAVADYLITDMVASSFIGPGLDLAEDGFVHLKVEMEPSAGGDPIDAILRLPVPKTGDSDFDGDVDLLDHAGFQVCYSPLGPVPGGCEGVDFDDDGDVDLDDYAAFEYWLAGPAG